MISFITLLSVVVLTIIVISLKWLRSYKEGKMTRTLMVRNTFFEISGVLISMTLAGLLGRYIAEIATEQIGNNLTKLIAGIVIGLLVGLGVGVLMKRTWGRLVKL